MLPNDVRARKEAAAAAVASQTTIEDHATLTPPRARVSPYSDEIFEQAAIEWLIETDQVSISFNYMLISFTVYVLAYRRTWASKVPAYD